MSKSNRGCEMKPIKSEWRAHGWRNRVVTVFNICGSEKKLTLRLISGKSYGTFAKSHTIIISFSKNEAHNLYQDPWHWL